MIKLRFACGVAIGAAALVVGCGGGSGGGTGGAGMAGHPGSGGEADQPGSGGTGSGGHLGEAGNAGSAGAGGGSGGAAGGNAGAAAGNAGAGGGSGGAAGEGGAGGHAGATGTGGNAGGQSGAAGGHAGGGAGAAGGNVGSAGGQSGAAGGQSGGAGQGGIVVGGGGAGGGPAACQTASIAFTPRAPVVQVLVDRAGASFDTATTGTFFNLRAAVEQTVASLQDQVRFGLGVYVGSHASGVCQLDYESVAPAIDNANAIKVVYDGLGPVLPFGTKTDTPAVEAIPAARTALQADTSGGDKVLLFVTDGETDFCDDGNALCSADAVTYQLQGLYSGAPRIATRIVGIPGSPGGGFAPTVLQNFANAGAGQPAVIPMLAGQTTTTTAADVYYECDGMTDGGADSWTSLYTAAGLTGVVPLATYARASSAPLYMAASTSVADLQTAVTAALSSIVSCTFDLSSDAVDTTKLSEASVMINGTAIAQSAANGWSMPSGTELVLNGTACTALQAPGASIAFEFPCDIITIKN